MTSPASSMVLHFTLSVVYALAFALIAARLSVISATLVGAIFGLILYVVNFYAFTAVFPWFANARNWVSIFAHLVFGAAAALTYKYLEGRHQSALPQSISEGREDGGGRSLDRPLRRFAPGSTVN